jgi:stringent starvation protein B
MVVVAPYLIRAYHQWMEDAGLTAHVLIDCTNPDVVVPTQFIQQNKLVLNISSGATQALILDNNCISFKARFSGQSLDVYLPIESILSIYAKETNEGIAFEMQKLPDENGQKPGLSLVE